MEYMKLPIESIRLDLDNPRIKQYLEIYGDKITSEAIALALSESGGSTSSTYSALKESIKVNKGIINPILVNRLENGEMVVIEGNTRLQIYKEFAVTDPEGPWNEIIAIVYDDLPRDQIHAIRLQSHLVGPREWDPFSKAKYLNQLSNIDKLPMSMIISFCGGKKTEIVRLIDAYQDMLTYYFPLVKEAGMDPNPKEFSKFAELQNGSVRQALKVHKYTKSDFAKWVIDGNIDTAQNVRKLPMILDNPVACDEFLKSTITDASKLLNAQDKSTKGLEKFEMCDLVAELILRCRKVEMAYVRSLRNDPRFAKKKEDIFILADELNTIIEDIEDD